MIFVESVKVKEIEGNMVEIMHVPKIPVPVGEFWAEEKIRTDNIICTQERIEGCLFKDAKGKKWYIGWSKQVEEAIGLPLKAFNNMSNEIEDLCLKLSQVRGRNVTHQKQIKAIKNMGFFCRLKCLFLGYK